MPGLAFDWFRNRDGDSGVLTRNVQWLYHYISLSGAVLDDLETLRSNVARVDGVFKALNIAYNQHSWAYLFDKLEDFPLAASFFLETCRAEVIIGYELSRAQLRLLSAAGKTYINLRTHPIRFLPDYHLALSTNSAEIHERAQKLGPTRQYIDLNVSLMKARAARRYQKRVDPHLGAVFFAQTAVDSSRIRNGEILSDEYLLAELSRYFDRERLLNRYVKSHPHEEPTPELTKGLERIGVKPTNTSTYDLLSVPGLRVCALSSSVCHEAQYFGAFPVVFLDPEENFSLIGEEASVGDYLMLPANIYSPDIWDFLLTGRGNPSPSYPEYSTPFRISSGLSWG